MPYWQAALGVTVRVPHLCWMSMKGEAKRDYPASIFYQSPWWEKYRLIADHFARVGTAMTRGKAAVRVAVVHPIESYWLHFGPSEQTAAVRGQLEARFKSIAETLLVGKIDFDYLCEALLPEFCPEASAPLKVGEMTYDAVVVACETLRKTTLTRLRAFREAGGDLIFVGKPPRFTDAEPDEVTLDENVIARQCAFIDEIHAMGKEVLLSNHTLKFMDCRRTADLVEFLLKRKPDVIKLVGWCATDEQLAEYFRTVLFLKAQDYPARIHYHCSGPLSKATRFIGPMLGSYLMFCIDRYDTHADVNQLPLREMLSVYGIWNRL